MKIKKPVMGRPIKYKEDRVYLSARIPNKQYKAFKRAAGIEDKSIQDLITEQIQVVIDRNK